LIFFSNVPKPLWTESVFFFSITGPPPFFPSVIVVFLRWSISFFSSGWVAFPSKVFFSPSSWAGGVLYSFWDFRRPPSFFFWPVFFDLLSFPPQLQTFVFRFRRFRFRSAFPSASFLSFFIDHHSGSPVLLAIVSFACEPWLGVQILLSPGSVLPSFLWKGSFSFVRISLFSTCRSLFCRRFSVFFFFFAHFFLCFFANSSSPEGPVDFPQGRFT